MGISPACSRKFGVLRIVSIEVVHVSLKFVLKRAAFLEALVSTDTCEQPVTANDRVGNWDVDQFGKFFQWFSTAKCSTLVNHGVSFPYLQTCEERIIRLLLPIRPFVFSQWFRNLEIK